MTQPIKPQIIGDNFFLKPDGTLGGGETCCQCPDACAVDEVNAVLTVYPGNVATGTSCPEPNEPLYAIQVYNLTLQKQAVGAYAGSVDLGPGAIPSSWDISVQVSTGEDGVCRMQILTNIPPGTGANESGWPPESPVPCAEMPSDEFPDEPNCCVPFAGVYEVFRYEDLDGDGELNCESRFCSWTLEIL